MIYINFTILGDSLTKIEIEKKLSRLPINIQQEILSYKILQDQNLKLAGRLLLQQILKELVQPFTLNDLQYTTYGRPFFPGDFQFNISHSGNIVVCAAKLKGTIGIDIEQIKEVRLKEFKDYFTNREWDIINSDHNSQSAFFNAWAKKEAFLKATGMGINLPLNTIDVSESSITYNNEVYYFHKLKIANGYQSWLCCDKNILKEKMASEIVLKEIPSSTR